MEDFESKARMIAEKAASRDDILPFLRLCAENKHLSLINQLLIYEQKSDAKTVCGKAAWERLGRKVKADAVSIQILFPEISPGQDIKYREVNVYDYDSTEGQALQENQRMIVFADRITQQTGATWEIVPEAALKDSLNRGFYDGEKNVFYLAESCIGGCQERTVLELYIDYVFNEMGIQDKLVRLAVAFVVYEHFHLKHTIVGALFGKVGRLSSDEKWVFLMKVWNISMRVLDDMEGHTLNFNEIAFLNSILTTSEPEGIQRIFESAASFISNEDLREELLLLKSKLMNTKTGYLEMLCQKRYLRQLFSYPSILLELEDEDYLRRERRAYDAGYGYFTEN